MPSDRSRLEEVSRRAFLRRSGLLAGAVVVIPGLACAKSDEEVFADGSASVETGGSTAQTTTTGAATTGADAPEPTTTEPTTTTEAETTTTEATTTTAAPTEGLFPAGTDLVVDFTFAADGGGRVRNPYIAVWIEDPEENLVKVISLWYESGRNERYLSHLSRFVETGAVDAATADVTGATRSAGSYSVAWDGTDLDGEPVALGDYVVNIEAAREHGPYEIVRGTVTIDGSALDTDLEPSDELTAAHVSMVV